MATITDPTNQRSVQISYPAEAFDDLIDGYARNAGFREDGQEISAEQFPQAKNHPTYSASKNTWKPTKVELVHAHILVEVAMKAAQGLAQKDSEASAEQRVADSKSILANGWATISEPAA